MAKMDFYIQLEDYVTLANKMKILAEDDEICKLFSTNSIKIRKELNLDKIVSRWEETINDNV